MSERWLVACDLDGTLFDESLSISPRVRATLRAVQAAGHALTLATGRMYRATRPIADQLGVRAPLICYQGAMVRDELRLTSHLTLPLAIAQEVLAFAEARDIHVNAYVNDRLFVAAPTPEARFYQSLSPNVPLETVGALSSFLQEEPTKLVLITEAGQTAELLAAVLARWGGVAQVVRSHARFVELTHPDASKGRALLALAQALGIPAGRTLAVGDNLNDVPMLRAAAVGVAMGNASEDVQAAADWVAPTLAEDGAAVALARVLQLPEEDEV